MSKEVKNKEPEVTKGSKKYVALTLVIILAIVGIMSSNDNKDETTTTTVAITEQVPAAEQAPATEQVSTAEEAPAETEPTVARIDITTPLVNADESQFEVYVDASEEPLKQAKWMVKFGKQGYVIQGNEGKKDIVIKTFKDANIKIVLKGRKEDNNLVKYTTFDINSEKVLNKITELGYNNSFNYIIKAKAYNEYNIHIEWTNTNNI